MCVSGTYTRVSVRAEVTTPFEQTKIDRQVYVIHKSLKQDSFGGDIHTPTYTYTHEPTQSPIQTCRTIIFPCNVHTHTLMDLDTYTQYPCTRNSMLPNSYTVTHPRSYTFITHTPVHSSNQTSTHPSSHSHTHTHTSIQYFHTLTYTDVRHAASPVNGYTTHPPTNPPHR